MKLGYFDDYNLGVLNGGMVVHVMDVVKDIPYICPDQLINGFIEQFDQ
jgi:hypothetical protein